MAMQYSKGTQGFWSLLTHYNHEKYWKMREYVVAHPTKLKSKWYLLRIKRMDAHNNASMGTHLEKSAVFLTKPYLPHGLNGIIVSNECIIGRECIIYHQATIAGSRKGAPVIGDHVEIGAGAKIIGKVHVGDYARIGAGVVVANMDVPAYSTVVAEHPKVILREG